MERTVRFAVAIAAVCGLVVVAVSCGQSKPTPPPGLNEAQLAGWQAYVDLECASCHGVDREGKRSGPPLAGLAEHGTADQLVSYLGDPDAMIASNPRLAYKAERYAIAMPAVSAKSPGYAGKVNERTLATLAEYMLVDVR